MRFLLDRFPRDSFNNVSFALEEYGHSVALAVFTIQSKNHASTYPGPHFFDRDIATGRVTTQTPTILGKHDLDAASKYEGIAISLFSRFDVGQRNFSAQEMSSHYLELYNFWLYQIKAYSIDFCLHHYLPHDPSSFVLYAVLKNNRVPAVFIDVPHIFNRYRPLACSLEHRSLLIRSSNGMPRGDLSNLSRIYKTNLEAGGDESIPLTIRYRSTQEKLNTKETIWKQKRPFVQMHCKRIAKIQKAVACFAPTNDFFKISRHSWTSRKNCFSKLGFHIHMQKTAISLLFRRRHYESNAEDPPSKNYVYFPMSAQPEGTTLPAALILRDVFVVLRLLREAVPQDTPILFKENPSVFETRNPYISAVNYRAPDFYERLLEIPNLKFVSTKSNSHDLIKNATAVATINGTAAVEAVYLGRPAVTFSSNWYDDLDGIHRFESVAKLRVFYEKARRGTLIPHPELINLNLDTAMLIPFSVHNPYEFPDTSRQDLARAFLASVEKFANLDERKWAL